MERRLAGEHAQYKRLNSWRAFWAFAAAYAGCLALLLPRLSLWLDEIVDLRGIRGYGFAQLVAWVPVNAGGVPLGYLTRSVTIHLLGYSTFSARLPSAVFSLLACWGVFVLGRLLKLRFPLIAVLIFCVAPLQLRYALESRPYSLALALSVWASVIFLHLLGRITAGTVFLYGFVALLGLYTIPYTIFVPLAHLTWLCCVSRNPNRWRVLAATGLALAVAAIGFLPWYLWTAHLWSQSVASGHLHYAIGPKAALLVLRELVGAGYIGAALIVGLAGLALKGALPDNQVRLFWLFYTVLPIVLAVFADVVFGYFLAIRQMIFVVAPLSLLATLGIERLALQRQRVAAAICAILVAVFLVADLRFFSRPREDWESASRILRTLTAQGSCVAFVPANSMEFYRFFVPQLAKEECASDVATRRSIAVAVSPYASGEQAGVEAQISKAGFTRSREFNSQGPKIELYERR